MNKRIKHSGESWARALLLSVWAQAIFAVVVLLASAERSRADWPFQRGDASASGASKDAWAEKPSELWRFEVEDSGFEATAVIAAGRVYLGDFDGTFYALDLATGDLVWKKKFSDSGFLSAAAVVGDRVFVGDYNGMFRCLSSTDGKLLWQYEARGEMYAGPNVHQGTVLVTTEAGELLALEAASGELIWQFRIDAPLRCWPTVLNDQVLLAGCDSRLHAIDLKSGAEVNGLDLEGQTGATPVRWQDSVFFGTASGTFYRIAKFEVSWTNHDANQQEIYSAATDGKHVIYTNKGKNVICLDPESGKPNWESSVQTPLASAPILVGDSVVFGTKRGKLFSLALATGDTRWEFEAGGDFLAAPAVSQGKLVVANTDGTVYCFGRGVTSSE